MDVSCNPIILKLKSLKEYYFHPSSPPLSSNQSPPPQNSVTLSFSPQAWDVQPPHHPVTDWSELTYIWNTLILVALKQEVGGANMLIPMLYMQPYQCTHVKEWGLSYTRIKFSALSRMYFMNSLAWVGFGGLAHTRMELLLSHPHHCLPLSFSFALSTPHKVCMTCHMHRFQLVFCFLLLSFAISLVCCSLWAQVSPLHVIQSLNVPRINMSYFSYFLHISMFRFVQVY